MKRRLVSLLLSVCMVATMFVGCGSGEQMSLDYTPSNPPQETETTSHNSDDTECTEDTGGVVKLKFIEPSAFEYGIMARRLPEMFVTDEYYSSEFRTFMNSNAASEAREAFDFMRKQYDFLPDYSDGEIVVDKLAYTISYDGETFEPIQLDEEYVFEEGMQVACLYQYNLVPFEGTGKDTITVSVVILLVEDIDSPKSSTGNCKVWKPVGIYNIDSMSKYFDFEDSYINNTYIDYLEKDKNAKYCSYKLVDIDSDDVQEIAFFSYFDGKYQAGIFKYTSGDIQKHYVSSRLASPAVYYSEEEKRICIVEELSANTAQGEKYFLSKMEDSTAVDVVEWGKDTSYNEEYYFINGDIATKDEVLQYVNKVNNWSVITDDSTMTYDELLNYLNTQR